MYDATPVLLAAETDLPMTVVGWGILLVSVAITAVWLAYLYR